MAKLLVSLLLLSCTGACLARRVVRDMHERAGDSAAAATQKVEEVAVKPRKPFLQMTSQDLLHFKSTSCGKMWPEKCSEATDGWLCNSKTGKIDSILIYKNPFKFEDAGPGGPAWDLRARCVRGVCQDQARNFNGVAIKKISEIGAQLCEEAFATPQQVEVTVAEQSVTVDVQVQGSGTGHVADISVQLKVPSSVIAFEAMDWVKGNPGTALVDPDKARHVISSTFSAAGFLETATAVKVCGHGFTNAPQTQIDNNPKVVANLLSKRAMTVANLVTPLLHLEASVESVAHFTKADDACATVLLKLNGAASESCKEKDWKGPPLLP